MSLNGDPVPAQASPAPQVEPKLIPKIPRKLSTKNAEKPVMTNLGAGLSVGKVKQMVNEFSQKKITLESEILCKPVKRPPAVKPKPPRRKSAPITMRKPCPHRASGELGKMEVAEGVKIVEGGRSAPDGREVEVEVAAEEPLCQRNCRCICHLKHPGMRLVWVPVEEHEDKNGGKDSLEEDEISTDESEHEAEHSKAQVAEADETSQSSEADDKSDRADKEELQGGDREQFQNILNSVFEQGGRSRSSAFSMPDLGLHVPRSVSPNQNSLEEDVYEDVLQVIDKSPPIPCRKPARRSKQPRIESTSPPPAVPPRVPLQQDKPRSPCPPNRKPPPPPVESRRNSTSSVGNLMHVIDTLVLPAVKESTLNSEAEPKEPPHPAAAHRTSGDWKTQLEDGPLYQTYRATVITKEIRRQTVCRNISKTSIDFTPEFRSHRAEGKTVAAGGSSVGPGNSTLWQDLPVVRESDVLQNLSSAEIKYQESMFEVLTSEASYLRSLRVLTDHFMDSRELDETLIILDKKTLFSNILRVREVSERFLRDLENRMDESLVVSDICDIVHYHAQHHFPAYIDYVRNQIYQEKTYSRLMQKNSQFAAVITRLQESPQCHRLPFVSFLLLPFQRITRIKMLVENILKRTEQETEEELSASKALNSVSKIIDVCNSEVGKMKQMEELILINKTLEFEKLKAFPIISQNRFLEKQGELQEMSKTHTVFNRPRFTPINLFLFNDLLLLAVKKSPERYVVLDYAERTLVQVHPLQEDITSSGLENCFSLSLLKNHKGRQNERLLKAPTQSDMDRWLSAFPQLQSSENETEQDVVYDDWDYPQVQCVVQYMAQQSDELNLEQTDIVNILRKSEGWYEGIRLTDGQKGWFPITNVLEITNEHVRRRNLQERQRVLQAATKTSAES